MKKDFKTKTLLFLEKFNHPSEETENLGRKQLNRMRWLKINKDTNLKIPHLPYLSIPWKKATLQTKKRSRAITTIGKLHVLTLAAKKRE